MNGLSSKRAVPLLLAVGSLFMACDVPTEVPHWDTTWRIPVEALELTASSLLPSSVSITPDGGAFELMLDAIEIDELLGDICDECQGLDGQQAVKPAFITELGNGTSISEDVVAAAVAGGQAQIELYHDFGFDPLRPSATARGSITILITSAGDTLASGLISGEEEAFPSGTRKYRTLPFRKAQIRDTVEVSIILDSPEGEEILINNSSRFELLLVPSTLQLSEAKVRVEDLAIDLDETTFKTVGGDGMVNRIRGGALLFEIDNPFEVAGALNLTLSAPGATVAKQVQIKPGNSEFRVEYSGSELRSVLVGEEAALSATGSISAAGTSVTIRPDQVVSFRSRFELTIATKEN